MNKVELAQQMITEQVIRNYEEAKPEKFKQYDLDRARDYWQKRVDIGKEYGCGCESFYSADSNRTVNGMCHGCMLAMPTRDYGREELGETSYRNNVCLLHAFEPTFNHSTKPASKAILDAIDTLLVPYTPEVEL